jgi:uncharacterized protein (TIGR02996 family)
MSLRDAFLSDIAANIDDDAPRLVYADWLEENGDPDRAAFIRAQCRLAKMGPYDPERFALEIDEWELREKHEKAWLKPLPRLGARVAFARGFPHHFALSVPKFLTQGEALLSAAPTLREYRPLQHAANWEGLLRSPLLGRMTGLDLGLTKIGVARAEALMASPMLANMRVLGIGGTGLRARGVAALAGSPHLRNVRRIDLRGNDARDAAGAWLGASPNLPNLVSLELATNGITAGGLGTLARSPLARRLELLSISEDEGGDDMAISFGQGDWASLRNLSFSLRQMTAAGIGALAACPSLSGLRHLYLNFIDAPSAAALFASPHLAGLEGLSLPLCAAGTFEALARSPMLASLRDLSVECRDDSDGGAELRAVLASRESAGLVALRLSTVEDAPALIRALAEAGHLVHLRRLSIGQALYPSDAVAVLAGAAHLSGLVVLNLGGAHYGPNVLKALAKSPHLNNLRRLHISSYCSYTHHAEYQALQERFGADVVRV